jgi:hypothetical protein
MYCFFNELNLNNTSIVYVKDAHVNQNLIPQFLPRIFYFLNISQELMFTKKNIMYTDLRNIGTVL